MAGPSHSAHWKRLIAGTLALLAAAFAVPRLVPPPALDENRVLAGPPAAPTDLASLGKFRTSVDAYVADRFPPRAHLIGALNYLRLLIGVSGSPRVIVGRDGWLFFDDGTHLGAARGEPRVSPDAERRWLEGLAGRSEALARDGAVYLVVSPPDKEAVYPQHGPGWFRLDPQRNAVRLDRLAALSQAGEVLYLGPAVAAAGRGGAPVYAKHDTHWTGPGAYAGYAAIMTRLKELGRGDGPRPLSAFREVRETEANKPRNLALMLGVASFVDVDYPELGDPPREAGLTTAYLTDEIDWTKPRVIDTGVVGKPVLLMTMDSFSNALLPFLYGDFSRIVLTHHQDGPWREDLIARFQPDVVMLEVVESGLPVIMQPAPPASAGAHARIAAALAAPDAPLPSRLAPPPPRPPRPLSPLTDVRVVNAIDGTAGPDVLTGTPGDDQMLGRAGADRMLGLGGADVMRGGRDDDIMDGGEGDDWLSGGRGRDILRGGPGADVFNSFAGAEVDVVLDFNAAEGDRVVLDRGTAFRVRQDGDDTVVEMEGARLVLKGVRAAGLPSGAVSAR